MDFRAAVHGIHRYERFVGGWVSPAFGCVVEIRGAWVWFGFEVFESKEWGLEIVGLEVGCGNESGIQQTVLASG